MAQALRRLSKSFSLGVDTRKHIPGPFSAQTTAAYAKKASQEEDMKKKKKKKDKKKEKKKGASADTEKARDVARFDDLVGKAQNAPSPVRHVKQKERLREQEMEKYGLMTKARQVELDQIKSREKVKLLNEKGEEYVFVDDDAEKRRLRKEEGMRLAKAYSRLLMREDRKLHTGETIRLRLKNEAIAALPPGLQEAARVPDMTPFPGLSPATLTPPIPDFSYEYTMGKVDEEA